MRALSTKSGMRWINPARRRRLVNFRGCRFNQPAAAGAHWQQPSLEPGLVASVQACDIVWGKTRCIDNPAFVDGFGNGQVLILSPCGDQNTTLGTMRLCDCLVSRIDLVNKLQRLAGKHTYLAIEETKTVHRLL